MKTVFSAFAAAAALSLGAAPEVISTHPEPDRVVRSFDRELCALFRFRKLPANAKNVRFTFDPRAREKIVRIESPRRIDYIIRDDGAWRHDPEIFSRIIGALFAYHCGTAQEVVPPRFLVSGMRGELRGLSNARRINRANRRSPFLGALLAAGKPIDFSCAAPDGGFVPAEVYQEEAGEILLYAAHRRNLLDLLKNEIVSGGRATEKLLLLLDDAARKEGEDDADRLLVRTARRWLWHEFSPRPAEISRREFAALCLREVPEIDLFGKPTGRTAPMDLECFFSLLATRPDQEALRCALVRDLRDFLYGEPEESRRTLSAIMELAPGPDSIPQLREALHTLDLLWQKREKVEKALAHYEVVAGGIGAHCPARIDAVRHGGEALSPRAVRFFDRVEKIYSGK